MPRSLPAEPFYALESAPALLEHPRTPVTNEPIPLPQSLTDLVRTRVRRLTADVRRVGWLVAASSDPREWLIRAACGDGQSSAAVDQAIDAGIVERDGDALRFTHPLLRSVLYAEMTLNQRKDVHQRLGATADDIEERAWHLALSAERPSEEVGQMLNGAAEHAASRGVPKDAAALTAPFCTDKSGTGLAEFQRIGTQPTPKHARGSTRCVSAIMSITGSGDSPARARTYGEAHHLGIGLAPCSGGNACRSKPRH